MIDPTNGRIVWFTPDARNAAHQDLVRKYGTKPWAAMIVHAWGERCVNLFVITPEGSIVTPTSVPLLQGDDAKPEGGFFATWMPYQKGQAAKAEAAESALVKTRDSDAAVRQFALSEAMALNRSLAESQTADKILDAARQFEAYLRGQSAAANTTTQLGRQDFAAQGR